MTDVGCPIRLSPRATAEVRLPALVLAAEATLPSAVDSPTAAVSPFCEVAIELLGYLDRTMLRPAELERRLLYLARIAAIQSAAFVGTQPGKAESDAVSRDATGLRDTEVAERIRYDRFFGLRRVADLDGDTLARGVLEVLAAALADLAGTQLGQHELRAILNGAVEMTRWIEPADDMAALAPEPGEEEPATPLRRFMLGHHLFALMADFAHHHIVSVASDPLAASAPGELLRSCRYLRGTTAAMWYSVSFPPDAYRDLVRPQMDAASSEQHGFSGGDNFDFRRLREAWEGLHRSLLSAWDGLEDATQDAARLLYETVVLDNEHHTALAAEMVGLLPSLDAARQAHRLRVRSLSAVSTLRLNTDDRRALRDGLPA